MDHTDFSPDMKDFEAHLQRLIGEVSFDQEFGKRGNFAVPLAYLALHKSQITNIS